MSDPTDPERAAQTPPGTARRPRSPRAQARQAAREAARLAELEKKAAEAAAAPVVPPPVKAKGVPAAKPEPEEEPDEQRKGARGVVCPRCGKYHDITDRSVGSTFECKCGRELYVAPIPEHTGALPATVVLRLRDLYRKRAWSIVGMLLAIPACLALAWVSLHLLLQQRSYFQGTCTGIAAIAFAWAAVIAIVEYRRAAAAIADEERD